MILDRWPLVISVIINSGFVFICVLNFENMEPAIPHNYDFLELLV